MKRACLLLLAVLWMGAAYAGGLCLPGPINYTSLQLSPVTAIAPPGLELELLAANWSQDATYTGALGDVYPHGFWTDSTGHGHLFSTFNASPAADGLRFAPLNGVDIAGLYGRYWFNARCETTATAVATMTSFTIVVRGTSYMTGTNDAAVLFSSHQYIGPAPGFDNFAWVTSRPGGPNSDTNYLMYLNHDYGTSALSTSGLSGERVLAFRYSAGDTFYDTFINGVKYSTNFVTYTPAIYNYDHLPTFLGTWTIGGYRLSTAPRPPDTTVFANKFNYSIKSLRLYNGALTDEQIQGYAW